VSIAEKLSDGIQHPVKDTPSISFVQGFVDLRALVVLVASAAVGRAEIMGVEKLWLSAPERARRRSTSARRSSGDQRESTI